METLELTLNNGEYLVVSLSEFKLEGLLLDHGPLGPRSIRFKITLDWFLGDFI